MTKPRFRTGLSLRHRGDYLCCNSFIPENAMIKLNVPDMSCGHCVGSITEAIKSIDPKAEVKTDLATKIVTVKSTQPAARISQVLDDAGYPSSAA